MNEPLPSIVSRWIFAALLVYASYIFARVFFHVAIDLYENSSDFDWPSLFVLAGAGAMSYFLGLLACRAFTGRGRSKDDERMPPWIMVGFIHALGLIAIFVICLAVYLGEWRPAVGGVIYLTTAYAALAYRKNRQSGGNLDA